MIVPLLIVLGVSVLFNVWQHLVIRAYRSEMNATTRRIMAMKRILASHSQQNGSRVS